MTQSNTSSIWENYVTELYDRPIRPETLEVEPEEETDTDEKGPYILQSEVEKAVKEMRNRIVYIYIYIKTTPFGTRYINNNRAATRERTFGRQYNGRG